MAELLHLAPGTRVGPYEIKALIGQGGMGEVYRAVDARLGRDVAIKILPAGFATDPDRLARFEREARTLASLNHPNIAQIHGVEDVGSTRAIVMELVEGEDVSQRMVRGPLPLAEALAIARQVAEAMQTAHDLGVIHRDLKPANVKVTADGTVKILDFGLAKVAEPQPGSALSQVPTVMASMPGTLLGTAAYMSPEQVSGRGATARSDVWAFGCLLFEMLTGRRAFGAASTGEILANVLTKDPDWRHLPPEATEPVRRLLRRCLQKSETNRLLAMADARLEIDEAQQPDAVATAPRTAPRSRTERLAWASVVALLGLVAVGSSLWDTRRTAAPPEVRFDITPDVADPLFLPSLAVSADGRQILFVADFDGQPHVWLRSLDSVAARPLVGTGGAVSPFWSPDGRSVAFYADGFVKRLDLDGGLVRPLGKGEGGSGGRLEPRWGHPLRAQPRQRDHAGLSRGGSLDRGDAARPRARGAHLPPLPSRRTALPVLRDRSPGVRGIYCGRVDGSTSRRLVDADAGGVYTSGHLLFIRQTHVLAQELDAARLELRGSSAQIAEGVFGPSSGQAAVLSAGASAFAFRAGAACEPLHGGGRRGHLPVVDPGWRLHRLHRGSQRSRVTLPATRGHRPKRAADARPV